MFAIAKQNKERQSNYEILYTKVQVRTMHFR